MNKYASLEKAVEITKEYVRGGGTTNPEQVLEDLYHKLNELKQDAESE